MDKPKKVLKSAGGKREGAGRKKGVPSRRFVAEAQPRTRTLIQKHSPLDVMILTMNGYISAAQILGENIVKVDGRIITQLELLHKAAAIAKDAAPYVHPRLATIEHSGKDGQPIKHEVVVTFEGKP